MKDSPGAIVAAEALDRDVPDRREGLADLRVISDCHFSVQLNHFIPGFLSYSVPAFMK